MASFTDQISKFNPYIAQLPTDAMVKVGMYKQAQYDAGVQKIQSYMDNIAGMDVYNEGDKAYLQSKLDGLGDNLKMVAAGDFSNQQLVNSVGGMATQIVKDPNVQNALAQTAQFRKILSRIEKDQTDGKAGANNIEDFYAQAKPWIESKTPGAKLQASYSQYRDVSKEALEIIKNLHPELRSIDIPFLIQDGKINSKAIGDAMKRNKIEGVTEGQIETALRAGLSAEAYNQLAIDGRSKFRDVSEDKLNFIINTDLAETKKNDAIELANLKEQLTTQVQDPVLTSQLEKRIKYYETRLGVDGQPGTLDAQAKANLEMVRTNPNKVKEALYTQGFFQQFGNGFKWRNEDYSYQTNPFKTQENWIKEMDLKWASENRQRIQGEKSLALQERKVIVDEKQLELDMQAAFGTPGIPVEEGNATDNTLKSPERLDGHMSNVAKTIIGDKQSLMNQGFTDAQVNGMVADYAKNGNKANVPATAIGTIQDILKQQQYFNDLKNLKESTRAEATAEVLKDHGLAAKRAQGEAYIQANFDPRKRVSSRTYDGLPIALDEKSFMDGVRNGTITYSIDKAPLGEYRLNINGRQVEFKKSGYGSNPEFAKLIEKAHSYYTKYGSVEKDIAKKTDDLFRQKLGSRVAELVPTITGIGFGKDHMVPTNIANNLVAFIGAADAKEIAADENYSTETAAKRLTGDNLKNTKVLLRQTADGYQAIIRDLTDMKNDQVLNMTQDQAIKTFGAQYVNTNKQDALRIRAGRGSNNVNGKPQSAPMQTQFGDFPNIHSFQVTAQLDEDAKYKGQFVPKIHLMKNDGSYQTFEISGKNRSQRLGYDQGKQQLSNLTDDTLLKLLKESYPKYDFSQIYRK
jgi:hypothetical protein